MTPKDYHQHMDRVESRIGRYVAGFRHYENYANYSLNNPKATIEQYQQDLRRECTLDEFTRITRQHCYEKMHDPTFRVEQKLDPDEPLPLEALDSQEFADEIEQKFAEKQRKAMLERKPFTLQDALESVMEYWMLGRNVWEIPTHNIYVPVKHTIMPKPDLGDRRFDQLSYQWSNPAGDRVTDKPLRLDHST